MFSENSAAKETNAAEAKMAENEVESAKLEGVDSARCKQLLVRDNAMKECKPLTDRVNMELAAVKNLKAEFVRLMLSKCHVSFSMLYVVQNPSWHVLQTCRGYKHSNFVEHVKA